MENLPIYLPILFGITTLLTIFLFYKVSNDNELVLYLLFAWIAVQGLVSYRLYYTEVNAVPPRFLWLTLPPSAVILFLALSKAGKTFMASLQPGFLTLVHVVRIPVELILFLLFKYGAVPEIMTLEGNNLDILSGLSAPFVYYFGFVNKKLNSTLLIVWNVVCLGLLLNIVVTAVLAAPFPFQQLGFEQPNKAVLYFPFTWLPCCIVPLVLLSHIASIYQQTLLKGTKTTLGTKTSKRNKPD